LHIVIKNPTHSTDFRLDIPISSTVLDLKEKLSQSYVNNPPPSTQKLIFAGRLLQDYHLLSEILRQHDILIPQTFHLVVRPAQPQQPNPPQPAPNINDANVPHPQNIPQGFPPGMHFYPYAAPYGYMQYGYQQYAGYPVVAAGGPPHYRPYGYNPYFPGPQGPPGGPGIPHHAQHQQPIPPNAQPPRPPAEGGQNMSLLVKLAILVFILGQGGSQERLFLLAIGAVIVFLFQTGRIPVPRIRVAQAPPPNNADANNAAGDDNEPQQVPQHPAQQQAGLLAELGMVVSSFVLSLLPTWQPQQAQQGPQAPVQPPVPEENNNF
jgi:hypothetical protein